MLLLFFHPVWERRNGLTAHWILEAIFRGRFCLQLSSCSNERKLSILYSSPKRNCDNEASPATMCLLIIDASEHTHSAFFFSFKTPYTTYTNWGNPQSWHMEDVSRCVFFASLIFPPIRLPLKTGNIKSQGSACLDILGLYPVVIVTWLLGDSSHLLLSF